jgi:hypothetical protein
MGGGLRDLEPAGAHPADSILERYRRLSERVTHRSTLDLRVETAARCATCSVGTRVEGRCSVCGKRWRAAHVYMVPNEVDSSFRTDSFERRFIGMIDAWTKVRPLIETVPPHVSRRRWDYAVASWLAYLDVDIDGPFGVVRWGQRFRPRERWDTKRVTRAIALGRRVVLKRLRKGGTMHESDGERELLGAVEGARLLGLPDPAGTGRRQALRLLKRGRVEGARDYGSGDQRRRWMAPRWAWERFRDQGREPPKGTR